MRCLRRLNRLVAVAAIAPMSLIFLGSPGATAAVTVPAANPNRVATLIDDLARFGADPDGGVSRTAYSDADLAAREYLIAQMEAAGLTTRIDAAGNLFGRREGVEAGRAPILFGSHADSVPAGGNYDGQVGVVAAIETARALHEAGVPTRHPLEVVVWQNEEGGLIGSKAFAGLLEPAVLAETSASGYPIGEGIGRIGGDVARLDEAVAAPGDYLAYLEVHIEQGGLLHAEGKDIGVVQGIVGISWWDVVVQGRANHAGTTPMAQRRDALVAAAKLVVAVNEIASTMPGTQVATVGTIEAFPGAGNVIPGRVEANLEIRDLSGEKIEEVFDAIAGRAELIGEQTGTKISFRRSPIQESPAATDPRLRSIITDATTALGYSLRPMPSGAGHDAQAVASVAPVGMIFAPSVDGISHSPQEFTPNEAIVKATNVLIRTVLAVDSSGLQEERPGAR